MPPGHTPAPAPAHPPTPPTLPQELEDLVADLARRLRDLESFQLPQLARCAGPLSLQEQFANDIRREMVGARRDLEELKLQVDDLDKARERAAGMEHVRAVQARIESFVPLSAPSVLRQQLRLLPDRVTLLYRNAVLSSKRLIDRANDASAREDLFRIVSKPKTTTSDTPANADDALMSATSDVTEGLRRTLQLMQQELDRSLVSNEILGSCLPPAPPPIKLLTQSPPESSTATMQLTSNQYSTFSTLLSTSKALITSLERADVLDRLLLLLALVFFGLCCAWVFKRRVIDRGIRVASAVGKVVGVGGGAGVKDELRRSVEGLVETATAVVAGATSVVQAINGKKEMKREGKAKAFGKERERKEDVVALERPVLAAPVQVVNMGEEVVQVEEVAVETPVVDIKSKKEMVAEVEEEEQAAPKSVAEIIMDESIPPRAAEGIPTIDDTSETSIPTTDALPLTSLPSSPTPTPLPPSSSAPSSDFVPLPPVATSEEESTTPPIAVESALEATRSITSIVPQKTTETPAAIVAEHRDEQESLGDDDEASGDGDEEQIVDQETFDGAEDGEMDVEPVERLRDEL